MRSQRDDGNRPPPTTGSRPYNYEILTLGTRAISQDRGVEKPNWTEHMEIAARGRKSRKALQGRIPWIFAAEAPRGRLRSARGRFFPAVSSIM